MPNTITSIFDLVSSVDDTAPADGAVVDVITEIPPAPETPAEDPADVPADVSVEEVTATENFSDGSSMEDNSAEATPSSDISETSEKNAHEPVAEQPAESDVSSKENADSVPDLSIVENKEKPTPTPEKAIEPQKLKVGDVEASSFEELYAKLLESEDYTPVVKNANEMTDDELDQAIRGKLCEELTPELFLFIWLLNGGKKVPREFKERFLIKSKSLKKGIDYLVKNLRKYVSDTSAPVHHSKLKMVFGEYLSLDDAKIAADKAKAEAERKAKAAEKAKADKEKRAKDKKSKTSGKSKSAVGKTSSAENTKATKEKASEKKASAPKAATNESMMSLFDLMEG